MRGYGAACLPAGPGPAAVGRGIDHRLPVAIALFFVASTDWAAFVIENWSPPPCSPCWSVRMGVIETVWLKAERQYDACALARTLSRGGRDRSGCATGPLGTGGRRSPPPFPTLAVLTRNAFVPTLARRSPPQQPVLLTEDVEQLAKADQPAVCGRRAPPPLSGLAGL